MIVANRYNPTHLDLSDMIALDTKEQLDSSINSISQVQAFTSLLDIPRLISSISSFSASLQVLHLNKNYLSRAQKLEIATNFGIKTYPMEPIDFQQEILDQNKGADQLKLEVFVKRNHVDHLLEKSA